MQLTYRLSNLAPELSPIQPSLGNQSTASPYPPLHTNGRVGGGHKTQVRPIRGQRPNSKAFVSVMQDVDLFPLTVKERMGSCHCHCGAQIGELKKKTTTRDIG